MKSKHMALCALFAALLALCAWISIPAADAAFTLQTLGVALCLWLLGGKWGTVSIFVYLLLGAAGCPVFSGFQGGFGALLGATGGYLLGFLVWGLVYWLLCGCFPKWRIIAMVAGLLSCYAFGSIWFWQLYLHRGSGAGLGLVLVKCVVPYLLPDAIKLTCAWFLAKRLGRFVY